MNTSQPVIIVRKRASHGGHHGGAWKVAYADFVTAMMAFFLVLWLVGQGKEVKSAVGGYFRDPVVFEMTGGTGILPGGAGVQAEPGTLPPSDALERKRLEDAVNQIRETLDEVPAFQTLRDQVEFTVTPEGLRIDLIEQAESSFFDSGSASLRGESVAILGVIAKELGSLDHEVDVEGHTDSRPYIESDRYSNWELSVDRANAARRVMQGQGLRPEQLSSVRGLADRQLRVRNDPLDPRNRRVSILVRSPLMRSAAQPTPDPAGTPAASPPGPSPIAEGGTGAIPLSAPGAAPPNSR